MTTLDAAKSRLNALLERTHEETERLGEEIREHVVGPVCERFGITFTQGMGQFFFSKGDVTFGLIEEAPTRYRRALAPIFELLNTEGPDRHPIGFAVGDYTPEAR